MPYRFESDYFQIQKFGSVIYLGNTFLLFEYIKVEANEIFFYRNLDNLVLGRKIYEKEQLRKLYF